MPHKQIEQAPFEASHRQPHFPRLVTLFNFPSSLAATIILLSLVTLVGSMFTIALVKW